eukprot:m.166000 g.166000  ORF g.166000 m.166000 type:complete len:377 (+) comp15269_c0_seq8:346-1476(+)
MQFDDRMQVQYPLMQPTSLLRDEYVGIVRVAQCGDYSVRVKYDKGGGKLTFECDAAMRLILEPELDRVRTRLRNSSSIYGFLNELVPMVQRLASKGKETTGAALRLQPGAEYYTKLMEELSACQDQIINVNPKLNEIEFAVQDSHGRNHSLQIQLATGYPMTPPVISSSLPVEMELKWPRKATLQTLLKQFELELEKFQGMWMQLEAFDKRSWILEPTENVWKANFRRVVIERSTSILIVLDPRNPKTLPECHFLGPDHKINLLRQRMADSANKWDSEAMVIDNLESVLDIKFVAKTDEVEDLTPECGICYTYKLEGSIPDKVCEDTRCGRPFHQSCLFEYIRTLPGMRQSFDTLFGDCPYCGTQLRVKMIPNRDH